MEKAETKSGKKGHKQPEPGQKKPGMGLGFRVSYWYVHRRPLLRRIAIVFLIAVDALLLLGVAFGLLNHYVIDYENYQQNLRSLSQPGLDYASIRQQGSPRGIQTLDTAVIRTQSGKYDFVANVANPDDDWWIESFRYRFTGGGLQTEWLEGFMLPGENKYVMALGVESSRSVGSARLETEVLKWKRVSAADYQSLRAQVMQLDVENAVLVPSASAGVPGRIEFDLANPSAFGFWQVGLAIVLLRGENAVGATKASVEQLEPASTRSVSVNWFEPVGSGTRVQVVPEVNLLDPDAYLPLGIVK